MVGDYLFDSTVNGTYDSADFVVDTIQTILRKQKYAYQLETKITTQAVNEKGEPVPLHLDYYELYDGQRPYEESFEEYFCEHYTTDLIREIWGWSPPTSCSTAAAPTASPWSASKPRASRPGASSSTR